MTGGDAMGERVYAVALKPCPNPWCASHDKADAEIFAAHRPIVVPDKPVGSVSLPGDGFAVACPVCPVTGPHRGIEAEAVAAWNTRIVDQAPAQPDVQTAADTLPAELARIQLLADVELHLQSCRVFLTSREKMHPCGVDIHDELLARVTAAIEENGHG